MTEVQHDWNAEYSLEGYVDLLSMPDRWMLGYCPLVLGCFSNQEANYEGDAGLPRSLRFGLRIPWEAEIEDWSGKILCGLQLMKMVTVAQKSVLQRQS